MPLRARSSALAAFVAVELGAAALWLWLGSRQWFIADEWAFLADRDGGDLHDLLRPHNEHWSTIPILVYRGLWHLVGLRSYVPYLVPVIVAHLAAAALLRVVMRRSGVAPWIATAAASAFALFGAGSFNITYAFQIGFSGALALGLAALVVADRDGGLVAADGLGIALCMLSLLCAGVAVVLVAVVALAVLIRRGPVVAVAYAVPPAVAFLAWATTAGDGAFERSGSAADVARFVGRNLSTTSDAVLGLERGWIALAALAVVGAAAAWAGPRPTAVPRPALPLAMLAGALTFALTTGLGRAEGWDNPTGGAASSRYVHITAALLLPAVAWAASSIASRWPLLVAPLAVLVAAGIPANVRGAVDRSEELRPEYRAYREELLTIAHLPEAREVPPDLPAEVALRSHWVTVGWLVDGADEARIPPPPGAVRLDPTVVVADLALRAVDDGGSTAGCAPLGDTRQAVSRGMRLVAQGAVAIELGPTASAPGGTIDRFVLPEHSLQVTVESLDLAARRGKVVVCP